jgi:tagatose 6-phosphate kinase
MRRAAPPDGWLVVTLGKDGAAACADGKLLRVTSPRVDVVSPIGSGDAFAAGLVTAMPRGIEQALRLATACGIANALTPHSGVVCREDVDKLMRDVTVEAV